MEDLTPHVVVTGSSSGIGKAAAVAFEKMGWRVTRTGRTAGLLADFADLRQVRELAESLNGQRIDVLANNAGLIKRGSTMDGFDYTMQVNHIAPFLLTHLLRDQMPDGARVINTSSMAASFGADPTPPGRRFLSAWHAYGTSKLANIYFAEEITRRWPSLRAYSFHPGVVRTRFGTPGARIWYRLAPGLSTPEQGADQLLWLATAPADELVNGGFYVSRRPMRLKQNEAAASRLWDATASLLEIPQ